MTVFEITAPDGRVLEIEGEKAPSETELNEIFKTVPLSQDAKYGKLGQTTISATPKRNIISDFTDCLKWVNNTRIAAYQEGKNQVEIAGLEAKDMFGRATQNDLNRLEQLSSQPENTYGIPEKRKFIDENETNFFPRLADTVSIGAKKGYVEALKMLPYMWETIKAGGVGAGVGAAGGAVIGTGVGMATTKTNTPALAMQGARLGASWGGRISGSIKLAELEGGLARNELRQINKEIIEKGGEPLSDAEINTLAIGVGGINAGLEMVSLKQMLKTVPGGDKVLEYLEKKNLRELAVNKTVREQLRGILGQYAKTIGTEITTEMAQETTNIVAGELARKFGRIDATPLEQNVARVIDTGKATFGATLYLGGVGSAAKAVTILGKQGLTRPQAEAKVAEMSAEEQQEFVANNLDALFESAKDIPSVQESEKINEIKNHYFTQNLNAGLEKTEALATAEIEANAAAIMSKQYGISLDEAKDRLALNVQSLTDEQAAEQMQADTKVLQGGIEMEVEKHNQVQFDRANIEDNFGDSVENITTLLKNDVLNVITENNLDDTEFNLQDARIYGSYAKGKNNEKSDLDIIVQYSGNMREDDAFNMFADAGLVIVDKNGNEIKVDVNPINIDKSGTIEDNLNYFDSLEPKFQSIESAGANANNINEAVKEWAEKGVESKYFKKWFGDSKVVDENGEPLVVYHGSKVADIKEFDSNKSNYGHISAGFNFFTNNKNGEGESAEFYAGNNGTIYECYISMKNPLVYNATGWKDEGVEYKTPVEFFDTNKGEIKREYRKGDYDGIIVKVGDNTIYAVPNSEQIKSVNNQGTFDSENPNIYFQSAMKRSEFTSFKDFYIDVLNNKQAKEKKQYNHLTGDGINIRIPHDTVIHDDNRHKLTADEWQELLDNIDDVSDAALSKQKSSYDGKSVLLKINTQNNTYGVVLETFAKNNPLISTAFIDTEQNIDNWIKNEAIPSGTKTSFLGTRLNNIIRYIQPKFKPFVPKAYFQADNIDSNIQNARGFTYRRFNFDGTVKDNLIVLLKNKSDKSTLLHEFAHVYLTTLNDLARDNAKAKADLLVVNKWLGYNGVEYTDFQHEKFANGFVAYVKTGKAPTYGLKKAFEQFKRWLNELYNELVYSDEIELDNEAKAVFDEILGGKSQEAVAEQIKEFVKKAENNALLRLRAEKVEKRELPQNMLTEYQRKYRDTAYDIIWYALSHIKKKEGGFEEPLVKDKRQLYMLFGNDSKVSNKNKGIMKQAEKLEFVLNEVDDVFSGNDGFLSEWGEFFNDPGIGQNEGADATLALTALDVIKQRKYLYETEKAFEGITEEDIKRAQYELDYILDEFKNNGGTWNSEFSNSSTPPVIKDRDLVVAGFFDWIENQPEFLQEDFITKWENSTNEIERYEALTKFEQAKEDLKLYAATLKGFGDYSWQFAEYARKILKRLDFMTEHDKAKIFDKLKDFNSFREIERNLDDVMDYAETLNDVSLRRNLADTIVNEVKRTTPIIKNGTKKTRYDYRTNKLFERLRYLNKLKQEEIQDLYDAYVNGEIERRASQFDENGTITGKTESYFEDIENSFLQFKANGMYYNSTELLQTLLSKIQNAKFTGKIARDEMDFEQRMNQENWINSCAQAIETHRGKSGKIEEIYSMEANFDSMLSMVFDDDIKNQFSLDDLYAQVDGRVGKDREEILNKIAEIFGFSGALKGAMLNNKFIEMANEKFTIKQRYANKERWGWEPVTLSKMEVLYYYIQAKNPVSYSMLTDMGDETHSAKGQFDKFEFDELLKNLSDQEKLMGDALQIAAEKYYNDLNKYHIKKHHIDLGKATCYFPRKSELKEINELDLFNQYTEKSTNPKFVKMRSAGPSIRIAPANPVNVLFNHIQKANTIIIMGDKLDLMNKVFRDNDLGQKIKSVFGDTVYKEFMQHVTENLYDGQAKALSNAEGIISKLMSNIIGVPMFIKPQVGLKQVLGLINYGVGDEYVGTLEWMKAFTNVIKNPKSAIDFMMQDEYLKDRLTRGNMNEAMKNQIDNKLSSKLSLLTDYFSLNMRYGDLFNLTLGGKAYVDVLMSKGYTKTQAFELFRKKTISDQQSSIASTLSNLQRNSKNNPFARLLFAYQNTPHQYFRICANAIIKAKRGRMSKSQAVKTVFIYWWFLPFIFNMAGSLSPITLIATGDPDELINDMLIACLGSISCIPFFGEMARALFAGVTGSEYFGNKDWFTRANEAIVRPINKFRKGNLRFEDILKSLEIFAQGLGIPLEEIDTQLEAFGDYANGDFGKGVIKTLGYSRYRADAVTGDK